MWKVFFYTTFFVFCQYFELVFGTKSLDCGIIVVYNLPVLFLSSMSKLFPYIRLALALSGVGVLSRIFGQQVFHFFDVNSEHELLHIFFTIAVLFSLSFAIFYLSQDTPIPSFVIAIFFGQAAEPFLWPLVEQHAVLSALVGFGATLILFSGGLETPFTHFKKLFWKIFSLSFPGLIITAFLFSFLLLGLASVFDTRITTLMAVVLGAVLASTDPAAIIPVLKRLRFHNRDTKDIIISESAVTDVTGTLLTITFLALAVVPAARGGILDWYRDAVSLSTGIVLLKQLVFGILFGIFGYVCLEVLKKFKQGHGQEFEADYAFFLFVPVIIFTIALAFGGSGYLAAFIAGLLFNLTEHLHETERFFNNMIDGFFKPTIFILLGALVKPGELLTYAGLGITMAFLFMFIIRPIAVWISLAPFQRFGSNRLSWREIMFISSVRETGAIPAVLMVTITTLGLPGIEGLVAVGMWVILLTLLLQPIATPFLARFFKVAEPISDEKEIDLAHIPSPHVVLGTRGHSFLGRLPQVVAWAETHGIFELTVLLCLENKYTKELEKEIQTTAEKMFAGINKKRAEDGLSVINFHFVSRTGFLQENINALAQENSMVTAIFVGRKMLDYRLNEIKRLAVPLYFMD